MKRRLRPGAVVLALATVLAVALALVWRGRAGSAEAVKARPDTPGGAAQQALVLAPQDLLTAQVQPLTRTIGLTGSLKAVRSAVIKAKVAGELQSLAPREGDAVHAGQVVGRIDATELDWRVRQAEQQAAAAQAQRAITQRLLENHRALVQQGYISSTALETAQGNDQAAQATWQAAQTAVELARKAQADAVLRAPIGGQVSQRLAQPGERLAVDARVLEIVDLSALELEAAVPAAEAAALAVGTPAQLQVEGVAPPVAAQVLRVNPATQAGTRSVLVYLGVRGAPGLRAGLFAEGTALLERRQALAVALSAVRTDEAKPYVIVLRDGQLRHVGVRTGARGLAQGEPAVEVIDGLRAGETLLRGTVGTVPDGTPARTGAAARP